MAGLDPVHLVGAGGVVGALGRHYVTEHLEAESFPLGTLVVNAVGSFALGVVVFSGAGSDLVALVGTGACGAFTTFSSFAFETVRLFESGQRRRAVTNAVGTLVAAGMAIGVAWLVVSLAR